MVTNTVQFNLKGVETDKMNILRFCFRSTDRSIYSF